MGFLLDPLSAVMLFVVTFVGFRIHVYSVGYMAHEEGFQRYFTYLNLFMGAMLLLVLGNNYVVMFVGWEGVGLCSYLLIGFYYKEEFPPYAGRKAFIVNRIGDFGFVLGLFALVAQLRHARSTRELFPRIAAQPALASGDVPPGPHRSPAFVALLPLHRRHRQVRADPALRLAAGRDGRPDAGLGADPRRHHGHRRRLHGGALERASISSRRRRLAGGRRDRLRHRALRRHHRARAERHQEGARLLDGVAARLHVPGGRGSAPTRRRSSTS